MRDERLRKSTCTLTRSMAVLGTKWKPIIIYVINTNKVRFGQLDAYIPLITRKVLTEQLKELVADGLLIREAYKEAPPRVVCSLSPKGHALMPIIISLMEWNDAYEQDPKPVKGRKTKLKVLP